MTVAAMQMADMKVWGGIESVRHVYGQTRDRIRINHDLASMAGTDPLTGLANQPSRQLPDGFLGLRHAVHSLFDRPGKARLPAVHCIDLDGFKGLNDRYGHATGDGMLIEIAGLCGTRTRPPTSKQTRPRSTLPCRSSPSCSRPRSLSARSGRSLQSSIKASLEPLHDSP